MLYSIGSLIHHPIVRQSQSQSNTQTHSHTQTHTHTPNTVTHAHTLTRTLTLTHKHKNKHTHCRGAGVEDIQLHSLKGFVCLYVGPWVSFFLSFFLFSHKVTGTEITIVEYTLFLFLVACTRLYTPL